MGMKKAMVRTRTQQVPEGWISRREQILELASGLFVRHGVAQVTTRQIAALAGISQPSLYAHFRSRDAIAVELCCRAFAQLRERLAAAAIGSDVPSRFRAMAHIYIDFGLQQEAAYRVAFMLDMPDQGSLDRDAVVAAGVSAFVVLRAVVAQTHADPDMASQSAWAGLHGLVSLLLARRDFPWAERATLIDHHVERQCAALYGAG